MIATARRACAWLTVLVLLAPPAVLAQSQRASPMRDVDSSQQRAKGNAAPTRPLSMPLSPTAQTASALPAGTLTLAYFGLYDDRVGPRGLGASGKPDGRFVLTIDVGKLTSRDLRYVALQAMDASSRPIGPVWHTRDPARSLLLVVADDQWLNTRSVDGLAILEGPDVDLILFADDAPDPDAVNAFIVEVGFGDGSIARQLTRSR